MVRHETKWIDPDFRETTELAGKDFKRVSEYVLKFRGKCGHNQMVNGGTKRNWKGCWSWSRKLDQKFTEKLNFRLVPQHNNTTNKVSEVEDPAVQLPRVAHEEKEWKERTLSRGKRTTSCRKCAWWSLPEGWRLTVTCRGKHCPNWMRTIILIFKKPVNSK